MSVSYQAIEMAIYSHRSHISPFPTIVNNVYCWGWESDLLFISKDWHTTEYEIKMSRSDYKADFGKDKHKPARTGYLGQTLASLHQRGPNYFYYVAPIGLLAGLTIPDYAGLIEVEGDDVHGIVSVTKKAPRLHREPLKDHYRMPVILKGCNRYWQLKKHTIQRIKRKQLQHPAKAEEEK